MVHVVDDAGVGLAHGWAPITKTDGPCGGGVVTVTGQIADALVGGSKVKYSQPFLDRVVPAWFNESGNIREQRGGRTVAAGAAVSVDRSASGAWVLTARVVDPEAAKMLHHKVYKGFDIAVKDPHITYGKGDSPGGEIDGGRIVAVYLLDRPDNPRNRFTVVKADDAGRMSYPVADRRERLAGLVGAQRAGLLRSIPDELLAGIADGSVLDRLEKAEAFLTQADDVVRSDRVAAQGYRDRAAGVLGGPPPVPPTRLWGQERAGAEIQRQVLLGKADEARRGGNRLLTSGYEQRAADLLCKIDG